MRKLHFGLVALATFFACVTTACSTYVAISDGRFMPAFDPAPFAGYRGKAIVMRGFENADDNTTIFMYPRSGPRRYGGPALTSYFWYCFRTSFTRIGVRVLEEGLVMPDTPVMDVRLVHLDDQQFVVDVTVLGSARELPFQKRYTVPGPPMTAVTRDALEIRAYQMVSGLFLTIVSDPQFQAVAAPGRLGV